MRQTVINYMHPIQRFRTRKKASRVQLIIFEFIAPPFQSAGTHPTFISKFWNTFKIDFQNTENYFQCAKNEFQGSRNRFEAANNQFQGATNDFQGAKNEFQGPRNEFEAAKT